MAALLVLFLALHQLQTIVRCELAADTSNLNLNAIADLSDEDLSALLPPELSADTVNSDDPLDTGDIPFVKTGRDQTEVEFRHPITSVNIDYSRNVIVLKFRKEHPKLRGKFDPEEARRRKSLENNFMRFGRASSDFMRFGRAPADFMRFGRNPADFMRFGKRDLEHLPAPLNSIERGNNEKDAGRRFERSQEGIRDSRGDNFMRFGRSSQDFMRFGRNSADFMRFGRSPTDFMRLGRDPADFMRFGRGGSDDFMRFGRDPKTDFMRFGRAQKMRRVTDKNFMRFGRPDNFMRFGRAPPVSTNDSPNFMRFGKMDQNFMRFGKSLDQAPKENNTKTQLTKNPIKEAAKLLHQSEQYGEAGESNPMDRAIKVLFGKQEHSQNQSQGEAQTQRSVTDDGEAGATEELDTDTDYENNMSQ